MDHQIIKKLREISGAGIVNCQKALKESQGNLDKALEILRKKGQKLAQSKGSRSTNQGLIEPYIH
ncbi:elongation factor Ts, partial [Patescibacteria group bacterium]|nr:elongation factor Ts [Patescibacteria group bacterium]